jgi:predicted O-methyltransferase YrrM
MEIILGNNKWENIKYEHSPNSERQLFNDTILKLIEKNSLDKVYGIEIGVLNGESSSHLLSISESINLVGIDPIIPDSMESSLIGNEQTIKNNTEKYSHRFQFIKDFSFNVVNSFSNDSVDFIFIDGDHTYEAVKQDFELYFPKIKRNGLIYFHDSRMFRGGANFHVGSSRYVDEIIQNNSALELIAEAFSLTCFLKK